MRERGGAGAGYIGRWDEERGWGGAGWMVEWDE